MSYLDLDFKSRQAPALTHKRRSFIAHWSVNRIIRAITALVTLIGAVFLTLSLLPDSSAKIQNSTVEQHRLHYPVLVPELSTSELPVPEQSSETLVSPDQDWQTFKIKTGDTLASIFSNAGLNASTTHKVVHLNEQTSKLSKIRPGQKLSLLKNDEGQLISLKYMPDITQSLVIKLQQDNSLKSEILHHPLDPIPVYRSGTINSSLFEAAADSQVSDNIIMALAGIFEWDIDFALDIRQGDQFGIVYNELYKDGVKIRDGKILAAEFVNKGKLYRAVYYTDPKGSSGYFSPDGKSMRKAFLRSPVKFSRISSRFTKKRWHPVLSKWRSHKGVDYAAAKGTPIRSSGDGKIKFKGTKGGYGKTIFVQHGQKYTTVYAHMSRYARGIKKGKRIKQGQIIGYVGSTGLASGPHLHYEFRVNGVHRNPLTVKLPAAEPVNKAYKKHFKREIKTYLSMLHLMKDESVAALD